MGYHLPAQYKPANDAVISWLARKHDWQVKPEWIVWTPGVVPAFNVACKAYCNPGDKVIVQTPNYPPLLAAPGINQMQRVDIPTVELDDRWTLDFDQLEKEAADPQAKLLILCNPMNPVGSVLNEKELARVAQICRDNDVMLCSDEIHCDLILEEGLNHLPAGNFPGLEEHSVTLMAASKTFNIAGLGTSFAIIPNPSVRARFVKASQGIAPWPNLMGLVATEVAFTQCDEWYQQEIEYLRGNRDYLVEQINDIEGLRLLSPEATFLAWVDASGLGVDNPQKYFEDKGVGPSPGIDFGDQNFIRINFGCPRAHLETAIARLKG